jgi:hypothetical protein
MPTLKLTCRHYQNILANCCGSEAAQSAICAVPCGTPGGKQRQLSGNIRHGSVPPYPTQGQAKMTLDYVSRAAIEPHL